MKKSITLFAILIGAIATIIFSCTRQSVPVPASSCIQIALSSAAGTTTDTVAVNTPITPISYVVTGSITGDTTAIDTLSVSVLGTLPPGVTGTFSGGVFTISGTPSTSVGSPFTYTVTTTGNRCSNTTITGSITVTNCSNITLSSATATTSQTVAINSAITPITYTLGGGATGESVIGMPAGVTGTLVGSVLTISGTPTSSAGSPYTYTVTTTGGSCTATAKGTIAVNPLSTIVLTSGSASQTVSNSTAITPIVYAIGGSATGAVLTGAPSGITGSFAGGVFTISGTPTASGVFTYTVTTTGAGAVTATGTITVNPLPTIVLTSGSASQTVSNSTAITPIVYAIGGSATGAVLTGAPSGITGSFAGGVFTISGTPTASGVFTYTVTTTGAGAVTATGTITVNPLPTIVLTSGSASQTVSNSTAITPIVYAIGGSATGAVLTGAPSGITGSFAGGVFTISGTPTASGVFTYTVTTTGAGAVTATGTITVNPLPTIVLTSGSASQTVSNSTAITPIVYAIGGSATGAVLTGAPSGITGSFAGGVFTISGTPTASGVFTYTVTTTGAGAATATGTITVTSASIIVSCGITTSSSYQFTWSPVTGATNYSISYTINAGAVNTASTTASSFTVNVSPGDVVVMIVTPIGTGSFTASTPTTCTAIP